jgi:transposase
MKYLDGLNRGQLVLFPEKLDDLVSEDNPVKLIDAFVDQLDLEKLGFGKTILDSSAPGAPCYPPDCLLKLYIFGYFKKTRSSRKLMEMCRTNIEVMWLLGRMTPDFRTIADFRKDNLDAIKNVFKAFVRICTELGLYNKEAGVQDGSKFRAVNSKDNNVTETKLAKKLEIAEERINKYLDEMDKNDREESNPEKYTKEEINEKLEKLRAQKDRYNEMLEEMKKEGERQKSFTDQDSRLMKTANGGYDVGYNVQTIVDPVSHMVGFVEVTNQCNDLGLLSSTGIKAKEDIGTDVIEITADKGYEDKADMLECLMNGIIPHVPSKTDAESYEMETEYKEAVITEELLDSSKPEDIKKCLEAGIIPNVYKDKGIEISVDEKSQCVGEGADAQICFTLNEEGTKVTCPNGSTLNKISRQKTRNRTRFADMAACRECTDKCTPSAYKEVDLKDGQTSLHTKKRRKAKVVRIKMTPDKEKIRNRKCVVEHPFGTVKRWCDGSYTLLVGKEKVAADIKLSFLAYNIKRAINMIGTQEFIEKMKGIRVDILSFISNFSQSLRVAHSQSARQLFFS